MNWLGRHMAQVLVTSLTPALAVSLSPGKGSCLPTVSFLLMESACAASSLPPPKTTQGKKPTKRWSSPLLDQHYPAQVEDLQR